jgi:hypothetical protein
VASLKALEVATLRYIGTTACLDKNDLHPLAARDLEYLFTPWDGEAAILHLQQNQAIVFPFKEAHMPGIV